VTVRSVPTAALLPFTLITFALSWSILGLYIFFPDQASGWFGEITGTHPAFVVAVWAPAFAAFAVVLYCSGVQGARSYLSRLTLWRCPAEWAIFLLIGIPLVFAAGAAIKGTLLTARFPFESLPAALGAMVFMLFLGPVEEFGWRGVALPILQRHMEPIWAGLIIGATWGLWHLPAFYLSGTVQSGWGFAPFFLGNVCLSVIVTPLFNSSRGSILWLALFHFQVNNPLWPDAQPYDTYLFVLLAVLVVWFSRRTMFTREGAVTEVTALANRAC
jgi:uncharacterized protein